MLLEHKIRSKEKKETMAEIVNRKADKKLEEKESDEPKDKTEK